MKARVQLNAIMEKVRLAALDEPPGRARENAQLSLSFAEIMLAHFFLCIERDDLASEALADIGVALNAALTTLCLTAAKGDKQTAQIIADALVGGVARELVRGKIDGSVAHFGEVRVRM